MKNVYVLPGKLAASNEPIEISTILGSCVSMVLYDETAKVSGLNHYLLPQGPTNEPNNSRYGINAVEMLIVALEKLGAERKKLKAKVYGGGNVLSGVDIGVGVGRKNIAFAEEALGKLRIPIVEKNVGGEISRKITLNVLDFSVNHRFIRDVETSGQKAIAPLKKIKVGIVDDSATVRTLFQNIFTKHGLDVVGVAIDAFQAREMIVRERPDVITLDIEMPRMNGVLFLEKLMKHMPMPVVMVSSLGSQGEAAHRALELGAIEFIHKPTQYDPAILKELGEMLVEKVRAAASTRVVSIPKERETYTYADNTNVKLEGLKLIVVGGNTGSQKSLEKLLEGLPADSPPVLIANSTIASFADAYIKKIAKNLKVTPKVAVNKDILRQGIAYFAPADHHMRVAGKELELFKGPPVHGQLPSADILFSSAKETVRDGIIGILLSGFSKDGVDGLKVLKSDNNTTMVEDPASCSFPYSPQQAIAHGVVDLVKSSDEFSSIIMSVRNKSVA